MNKKNDDETIRSIAILSLAFSLLSINDANRIYSGNFS